MRANEAQRRWKSNPENAAKQYKKNQETQSARWKRWYSRNVPQQLAKFNEEKARKIQRIPAWADLNAIKNFYLNRPDGFHVDHIVPLCGKNVSGLHVIENLQYLPAKENLSKGNRYTV